MTAPRHLRIADLPGDEVASRFVGRDHGASISVFIVRFPPGAGPALHRHPYEETFIVDEGRARFTVEGALLDAEAGELVVVPAGAVHGFVNSGDAVLRLVSIQPSDHVVVEWGGE